MILGEFFFKEIITTRVMKLTIRWKFLFGDIDEKNY